MENVQTKSCIEKGGSIWSDEWALFSEPSPETLKVGQTKVSTLKFFSTIHSLHVKKWSSDLQKN